MVDRQMACGMQVAWLPNSLLPPPDPLILQPHDRITDHCPNTDSHALKSTRALWIKMTMYGNVILGGWWQRDSAAPSEPSSFHVL